ncbi:hypothetical protein A3A71_01950 [Candidatus Berkelbacteria bacterium RIFCSPLOWO2_01_FULL_50_28]|uniref:Uncharacterized protein n=1 Tax=Candidatus Berkelbacteria bacterium RIFCSPLOWO2_01_FULL_50_28 TaxID=1797471 RepID=A0A1F5EBK1_9BACT|nr:MAG: hypothetical protein A3F39_00085 [Candidatus Berkelbacteria bacterium RIFCSPHIGHO2_12_FULL_50_11]OGD64787.1 MAG: hypothetical protein A3A71_01950 [Candidatus Berkelbacteria bacterium RIFCSPLOWO2_01_FULL_50_28]
MKKGSSLILVAIIMAGIIAVVFGSYRLALVQFNQSTRDEDKMFAYYAANAGIEDGLIRFRYNRDAETPVDKFSRLNLTTGHPYGDTDQPLKQMNDYEPTDQYYDLQLKFKVDAIGFDGVAPGRLTKDSTLQLSGFSSQSNPYYLRYKFRFLNSCTGGVVQIQQLRETPSGAQVLYSQKTIRQTAGDTYDSKDVENMLVGAANELTSVFRLRNYSCPIDFSFQTVTGITNEVKANVQFDGLKTYAISTGYFAGTKRTLVAEIDRRSGQLISIYDFNLYAGQGSISPNP